MSCAGVNIGALSVKAVALDGERREARVALHCGRPLETLKEMLAQTAFAGVEYFGVSGKLGHLTEVAAIRRALREFDEDFDAAVSLGGEAFLVYFLTRGRITNVLSHNKCAAGSGEFFVQQIGRMGLEMEAAIQLSLRGKVVPLASRCSVHCKSDITHKLNRNEAAPADILHTLHDSMANKVVALLEKGRRSRQRVLLIGGVILTCNQYNTNVGWRNLCVLEPRLRRARWVRFVAPCWPPPTNPLFSGCSVFGCGPRRIGPPKSSPKPRA